ncbi:hypothetical protein F0L68_05750 [Solihabitans fulvus]|uniref:Secreted protein n=1 Tax=Solihabitans fulvus TaxID=1892852 RepID=A0A5B2XMJ6_9PSEU|nr:bacteriophage spanin2 family protein [Solihabitans fulvus]KAA2264606.1 hypothetical protein F0L68_05750 [Solihabitans fulvus]
MRLNGRSIAVTLAAVGLAGGLVGCSAAAEAKDKASVCVDALKLGGFTPDLSDPAKSVEDAHRKAEELGKLADQAGDTTLRDALKGMAQKLTSVKVSDFDPQSVQNWVNSKVSDLDTLRKACS